MTRDQFAPEVHFAGRVRIEILTQPGIGPVRGNLRSGYYDSVFDGENPFVDQTRPSQSWQYGIGLNGTLISERASFNVNFNGQDSYSTPVLFAATPLGDVARNIPLKSAADNYFYNGGIDYALTRDQVLRLNFQGSSSTAATSASAPTICPSAPIRRKTAVRPLPAAERSDRPSIRAEHAAVDLWQRLGRAFRRRGADVHRQRLVHERRGAAVGRQHARNYFFNSDLDYVRGLHSMRAGIEVQGGPYNTDSNSNYLGTYVFASLDAFEARTPRSYTRRLGDPQLELLERAGRRLHPGRHQDQKELHADRRSSLRSPDARAGQVELRAARGLTWAPRKSGKTTLRGSWGMFYDWLPTGTYLQTLQVDGVRQRELNIVDPLIPRSGRRRVVAADQSLPPGGSTRHGVLAAAERGYRADDLSPVQHQRALQL